MHTVRLSLVGTAILVLLGVMPALAQESPEPSAELPLPLVTTGNADCTVLDRGTRGTSDGLVQGGEGARDQTLDCVLTMSDPRVSGTARVTFNDDCFATSVGSESIIWGASLLEGPDGDWDCTYSGTGDPMGGNDGLVLDTCTGTGGYSGLTFIAQQAISFSSLRPDFGDGTSIHGVIYEGPPPPPFASLPSASK
jgi:hypothetical protein